MATILWFRQDLRLDDNPALRWAAARDEPVIPVYLHAPQELGAWAPGQASAWWLHHSLASLTGDLEHQGSRLIFRQGAETLPLLRRLIEECGATAITWNRCYEPAAMARDTAIKEALREDGLRVESHKAALLFEPWEIQTQSGTPYKVFTPFFKASQALEEPAEPVEAPGAWRSPDAWPKSLDLEELELLPTRDWADGFTEYWQPGVAGANAHLERFLEESMADYPEQRDRPDAWGTSRLSPHLHVGELSPQQLWHACRNYATAHDAPGLVKGERSYLRQLVWREFAHELLYHFPETTHAPLYDKFADFPWRESPAELEAWQRGATGYPLVDAGMRELWARGWMHNRVRMVVGSFLVKDLLIHWREGAAWFWDTLVDADLANNTLGWQWIGGCGADASPYFRVFNPVTQSEKFDPHGTYIRTWVPELAKLPTQRLHAPWKAPAQLLQKAGVVLGESYPRPIVDHADARDRALEAYDTVR